MSSSNGYKSEGPRNMLARYDDLPGSGRDARRAKSGLRSDSARRVGRAGVRPDGEARALCAARGRARSRLAAKAALSLLLSCLLCFCIVGCKPTDFFTEVLVSSSAEQVDENATNRTIVNSPDADIRDDSLTALTWSDQSNQSEKVESLVTWSSEPNSVLNTHRSIYDVLYRFPSVESSDGVHLVFDPDSDFDHSVDSGGTTSRDDLTSVSPAVTAASGTDGAATQSNAAPSEGAMAEEATEVTTDEPGSATSDQEGSGGQGQGASPTNPGTSQGGNTAGTGEGTATSDDPGTEQGDTVNKFAGLGGDLVVFDPTSSKTRIPHVESVVVIGKQAAVITEAIGGSGSICAMSNAAYNNVDTYAVASFNQIFGDLGNGECSSSVITWAADTAESISSVAIEDFEAALATWPSSTLVIYDQSITDDPESLFTEEQLDYMAGYGLQGFWPVDFSSQAGIYNAANFVGQALSESTTRTQEWKSTDMATKYRTALTDLVTASEGVHGGTFVYNNQERESSEDALKAGIDYVGNLGSLSGSSTLYLTQAIIATDAATGLSYSGGGVDASGLVMFGSYGMDAYSPLSVWMRAAGVEDVNVTNNYGVVGNREQNTIFWGTEAGVSSSNLTGSGAAYRYWTASGCARSAMWINDQGTSESPNGLGSSKTPYLIVCGSSDGTLTSGDVKSLAVKSIESGTSNPTPYTAFSYVRGDEGFGQPETSYTDASGYKMASSIGASSTNLNENPFLTNLSASDVVRQNPNGLLGSWVEGNAESVLETLWLTSLYTEGPSGCGYTSSYNWGSYSLTIGDTKLSGYDNSSRTQAVRDTVSTFYRTFYRYDVDSGAFGYSSIVPDEGL